jgi:hypothetical protein
LIKDFYHANAAALEVKSATANGVAFKVTGKNTHEGKTTGAVSLFRSCLERRKDVLTRSVQLEARYADKPSGKFHPFCVTFFVLLEFMFLIECYTSMNFKC